MIEGHLCGMRARNGTIIFICSTCRVPSIFTFGAKDDGQLVYMMLCPRCEIVLAEWESLEARGHELSEFAKNLKLKQRPIAMRS
ncbi:MAG TPA: hypothetical protein VGD60_05160 [Candidatus Acidoferrales bacterium]